MEEIKTATKKPWISYRGPYDPDAIPHVLSQIDVLVVPSIWWENSPLVIHEALIYGLPILVSNIGGMQELADSYGGFSFERTNPYSLKEKVIELCNNRVLLAQTSATNLHIKTIEEDALETIKRYKSLI